MKGIKLSFVTGKQLSCLLYTSVLGNFTDEVTVLGVGVQIVLGIFDLDLPCDIRDIIADIKNRCV